MRSVTTTRTAYLHRTKRVASEPLHNPPQCAPFATSVESVDSVEWSDSALSAHCSDSV